MLTLEDVFDHAYLRENRLLEPSIHTEALILEETSMRVDAVTESRRLCTELDQLVDHATGMLERYNHLNTLCTHLKTYGLDQATLHLFNTDAVFQTLHIELPALESLGSYEYQEQLQAAQENMLELFQTAIDYVNQLWEKLKNWFARFVNFWMIRHMWYKRRQEKILRGLRNINVEFISSHRDELANVPLPVDPDLVIDFTSITPEQRAKYEIGMDGDDIRWDDIDEDIHISSFFVTAEPDTDNPIAEVFRRFPQLNVSEVARSIGINKSLLSRYIYGIKKPSEQRKEQIINCIRQLGRKMAAI